MIQDLGIAKDRVGYILENFPDTRGSDKLLWLAYLCVFHDLKNQIGKEAYLILKQVVLDKNTCTMESITCIRRRYQESGMYIGTLRPEKIKESELVRNFFKNN